MQLIWAEGQIQKVKKPKKPLNKTKLIFRLYFETNRRRDSQNYIAGGLIAIIDSLVQLRYIIDDNHKVIGSPKVGMYIDKNEPRTEIEIKRKE